MKYTSKAHIRYKSDIMFELKILFIFSLIAQALVYNRRVVFPSIFSVYCVNTYDLNKDHSTAKAYFWISVVIFIGIQHSHAESVFVYASALTTPMSLNLITNYNLILS